MVEVVIGGAFVSAFVVVMVVMVGVLADLANPDLSIWRYRLGEWQRARQSRKSKKRARKHREEPIYERIAKAYEWKAELHLQEGRIEQARDEFRKAEETRSEAMEAMMNGQGPKL